jgi:hypothetical protein
MAAHHHMCHMKRVHESYIVNIHLLLAQTMLLCIQMRDMGFGERLGTRGIKYPFAMPSFP